MKFARALAEQFCFLGVNSADQFLEQRARRRRLILQISFPRQDPFIITADRVERERPGVALAGDPALQQGEDFGGFLAVGGAEFDLAGVGRDVGKMRLFGQEPEMVARHPAADRLCRARRRRWSRPSRPGRSAPMVAR